MAMNINTTLEKVQELIAYTRELEAEVARMKESEELLRGLHYLCGYVQNGSEATVSLCQDDATREWSVYVDKKDYGYGPSLTSALKMAIQKWKTENPEL